VLLNSSNYTQNPFKKDYINSFLQQLYAIPIKEVHKFFCILIFKPEFLVIGKYQINPSFVGVSPPASVHPICPSYLTHVYTPFAYCEECGFHHAACGVAC